MVAEGSAHVVLWELIKGESDLDLLASEPAVAVADIPGWVAGIGDQSQASDCQPGLGPGHDLKALFLVIGDGTL